MFSIRILIARHLFEIFAHQTEYLPSRFCHEISEFQRLMESSNSIPQCLASKNFNYVTVDQNPFEKDNVNINYRQLFLDQGYFRPNAE